MRKEKQLFKHVAIRNDMNELISIIIPVYKVERYLEKCINSVIRQTYRNIEIILVDDGSPDSCPQICDQYKLKDDRIIVVHKENGGLSDARNTGLEIASGSYVTFIDSDDYVAEDYVEYLYNLLKYNKADISICNHIRVDEHYNNSIIRTNEKNYVKSMNNIEALLHYFDDYKVQMVVSWGKLYDITLFNNVKFPVNKINEDEFVTYKLLYESKIIVYGNGVKYFYLQRGESIMSQEYSIKRLDIIEAFEERLLFYKKINNSKLYDKTLFSYVNLLSFHYYLCKTNNYIAKKNEILNELRLKIKSNIIHCLLLNEVKLYEKTKLVGLLAFPRLYFRLLKISSKLKNDQ